MDSDRDPLEAVYRKVNAIREDAIKRQDLARTTKALAKLLSWLRNDRSLVEHRCYWAFISYLYMSYGEDYSSPLNFHSELKCRIGHCEIERGEYEINGVKYKSIKYMPKSTSFTGCSQKTFHEVFNRVKDFAMKRWGVDFDAWKAETQFGAMNQEDMMYDLTCNHIVSDGRSPRFTDCKHPDNTSRRNCGYLKDGGKCPGYERADREPKTRVFEVDIPKSGDPSKHTGL